MPAKKKAQQKRPRRLPHGLDKQTFSIKEAAAIADMADKTVRNEIYVDLFRVELDDKSRVAISARGVVYLRLIRLLPVQLVPKDRNALSRMLAEGWPVHVVGRVVSGEGVTLLDASGQDITPSLRGYQHFRETP